MKKRAASTPKELQQRLKEDVLLQITRLGDRDTQKNAVDEITRVIEFLEEGTLPLLLSCLYDTSNLPKAFARKECVRFFGLIATPFCPVSSTYGPHIPKVVASIIKRLKDSDSMVRDEGVVALETIAKNLDAVGAPTMKSPGAGLARGLMDLVSEQNRAGQGAGCAALGRVLPHLGVDISQVKALLRLLNSPSFQAKSDLIAALGGCELSKDGRVWPCTRTGLIASESNARQVLVAHITTLLGALKEGGGGGGGGGLLGSLASPDWAVRKAASDALRAVTLELGPTLDEGWAYRPAAEGDVVAHTDPGRPSCRAAAALEASTRYDKVKPVREAATEALAVLRDLIEFNEFAPGAGHWPSWIAGRCDARARAGGGGAERGGAVSAREPRPRASPAAVRETFLKAREEDDVIVEPEWALATSVKEVKEARQQHLQAAAAAAEPAQEGGAGAGGAGAGAGAGDGEASLEMWGRDKPAAPTRAPDRQRADRPQSARPGSARPGSARGGAGGAGPPSPGFAGAVGESLAKVEQQQERILEMLMAFTASTQHAFAKLESRVAAVEGLVVAVAESRLGGGKPGGAGSGGAGTGPGAGGPPAPPAAAEGGARPAPPGGFPSAPPASIPMVGDGAAAVIGAAAAMGAAAAPNSPEQLEGLYAAAAFAGEPLSLLRLMSKTGPCLEHLTPATAKALAGQMVGMLRDGVAVARLLPWLWQLVDIGAELLGVGEKEGLLASLRALADQQPPEVAAQCEAIVMSLDRHWA